MGKRKSNAPSAIATTIAAAAQRLKVHKRTLQEWLAAGAPGKRGAYDVDAIARWRSENRKPVDEARGESSERAKWESRKSRADALKKELELLQARGRLIELDSAARVMAQHVAEVKTHLLQVPERVVGLLKLPAGEKKHIRARIAEWVRAYCAQFENSLRELAKQAKHEASELPERLQD